MSDFLAHRSVSALRARYGDAENDSSALATPKASTARAGEIVLTPGQKIALLKMRGSDWSKAVLRKLKQLGKGDVSGGDFYAVARLGFATQAGSYHVLTPQGRRRADGIAMDIARAIGMHTMTYYLGGTGRHAARAQCTCGWSAFRSMAIQSYITTLSGDAQRHLDGTNKLAELDYQHILEGVANIMASG